MAARRRGPGQGPDGFASRAWSPGTGRGVEASFGPTQGPGQLFVAVTQSGDPVGPGQASGPARTRGWQGRSRDIDLPWPPSPCPTRWSCSALDVPVDASFRGRDHPGWQGGRGPLCPGPGARRPERRRSLAFGRGGTRLMDRVKAWWKQIVGFSACRRQPAASGARPKGAVMKRVFAAAVLCIVLATQAGLAGNMQLMRKDGRAGPQAQHRKAVFGQGQKRKPHGPDRGPHYKAET
jgi:hypothetical protein